MANMTEKQIFDRLVAEGCTPAGAAGLMGNLVAESGLRSNNLQNSYESLLGLNDEQYTKAVDDGTYTNFVNDKAGYGLAQWTYFTRKQNLLNYARSIGASIGDCEMQVEFLLQELKSYKAVWNILLTSTDVKTASDIVLTQFERPADMSDRVKQYRAEEGTKVYTRCADTKVVQTKTTKTTNNSLYSSLATVHVEFGTKNSNPRTEKITKFTIHHMAGNMSAEQCAKYHLTSGRDASANYYIGGDGTICSAVPENRRAWTSSSSWNDQKAITVEVANSTAGPEWKISDKAYNALIKLAADICTRYNITPYYDGTKNCSLTTHKMFWATACPGPYIEGMLKSGKIQNDILAAMGKKPTQATQPEQTETKTDGVLFRVQVGAYKIQANANNLVEKLKAQKQDAFVKKEGQYFKVQVGAFAKKENAEKLKVELTKKGYKPFVTVSA